MKKLALIVIVALALPATALAKGPSRAAIAGPGLTTIRISGAEGSATPFWRLVEAAGWFETAWGPSHLPKSPPQGELGPRYAITWTVPSSSRLRQDVYPYAKPYPVTYMPSGQTIYDTPVRGGWFVGGVKLRKALARLGGTRRGPATPTATFRKPRAIRARIRLGASGSRHRRDRGGRVDPGPGAALRCPCNPQAEADDRHLSIR